MSRFVRWTLIERPFVLVFFSRVVILELLVRFAQANNQWNIAAELADDPMDSAFARALTGGIKGVAMVSWWKAVFLSKTCGFWMFVVSFQAVCLAVVIHRGYQRSWTTRCSH